MKDGEVVLGNWTTISVAGVDIPIGLSWRRASGENTTYEGKCIRIETLVVEEGAVVDPSRIAAAENEGMPGGRIHSSALVRVVSRTALRLRASKAGVEILKYIVALPPRDSVNGVQYPELHVAYVAYGDCVGDLDTVARLCKETSLDSVVSEGAISPDGHLEFGPVPVPKSWVVHREGEESLMLPDDGSTGRMTSVWVGGGYLLIEDPCVPHSSVLFQPVAPFVEGSEDDFVSAVARRAGRLFPRMELARCSVGEVEFARAGVVAVCGYELVDVGLRRLGFVWLDGLGYLWELVYIVSAYASG